LIALYAIWSGYFVLARVRDEMGAFVEHETQELALAISRSNGSSAAIQALAEDTVAVSDEPPTAFRIRTQAGHVVAQAGAKYLLDAVSEPIPIQVSWRKYLLDRHVVVGALEVDRYDLRVELIVDASERMEAFGRFALSALGTFLVAVLCAGLSGWFTAHRGLRSLRDVVRQARRINQPVDATIHLDNAPCEVREVGTELNAMLARIEEARQGMRTFTAGLAHELRSPLQNLIGEVEVTLLAERQGEEYRQLLKSNLEDLHELSDAINNLIAFCRDYEPRRDDLTRERFDLAREGKLRLEREQKTAQRAHVELQINSSGDTDLYADREACLSVLRNLVSNAIEWSPPGAKVTVQIDGRAEAVQVAVEDEGPGIPEALVDKIFEPFMSGPRPSGNRTGFGLGLTICQSVVKRHQGRLTHERRPQRGTRFVAEFPRAMPMAGVTGS
jgi:two-component system heavy metal sensor histidine kinase CusS